MNITILNKTYVCLGLFFASCFLVGCEKKEKILDIETRGRSLEIERSTESGDIDIKIEDKK